MSDTTLSEIEMDVDDYAFPDATITCSWCGSPNKLQGKMSICTSCHRYAHRIMNKNMWPQVAPRLAAHCFPGHHVNAEDAASFCIKNGAVIIAWLVNPNNKITIEKAVPLLTQTKKFKKIWQILIEYKVSGTRRRQEMQQNGDHSFPTPFMEQMRMIDEMSIPQPVTMVLPDIDLPVEIPFDLYTLSTDDDDDAGGEIDLWFEMTKRELARGRDPANMQKLLFSIVNEKRDPICEEQLPHGAVSLAILLQWKDTDRMVNLDELWATCDSKKNLTRFKRRINMFVNTVMGSHSHTPAKDIEVKFRALQEGLEIYALPRVECCNKDRRAAIYTTLHRMSRAHYGILVQYLSQYVKIRDLKTDDNVLCQLFVEPTAKGREPDATDAIESFEAVFMDLFSTYLTEALHHPICITDDQVQFTYLEHGNIVNVQIAASHNCHTYVERTLEGMLQRNRDVMMKMMAMHGVHTWLMTKFQVGTF